MLENKGCGIICEYNPFHLGHKYQLERAKEISPFTVCVMSADFVQRGEACFQNKKIRAKNAVLNGADIVLELAFPYSSFGAEGFARKGVEILTASGLCSHIMFGSECGDIALLTQTAGLLCEEGFYGKVLEIQKSEKNLSFAKARQMYVENRLGKQASEILENPNDILGVEYIKAIKKISSPLIPVPIKRSTPRGGFDESFASSSYIRKELFSYENSAFAKSKLPEQYDFSEIFEDTSLFYKALQIGLMMKNPKELEDILEVPKGCGKVIAEKAAAAKDYGELCSLLSGKTLTLSKVKRMLLFAFFGVTKAAAEEKPMYTEILALSQKGGEMLKKYRNDRQIIIASRVRDIKQDAEAARQYNRARLAGKVLEKCFQMH